MKRPGRRTRPVARPRHGRQGRLLGGFVVALPLIGQPVRIGGGEFPQVPDLVGVPSANFARRAT